MGTFYARTLGSPLFLCLCPESKSRRSLASPPALQEPPPIQVPQFASQRAMLRAPGGSQAHAHPRFGFMLWLDGQAGTSPPSPAFLFGGSRSSPFRTHPLHALGFSFNLKLLKQGEVASRCFSRDFRGFSLTSLLSPRERQGWTRWSPELPSTLIPPQLGPTQKNSASSCPHGPLHGCLVLPAVAGSCLFPTITLNPPRCLPVPAHPQNSPPFCPSW